MERPNGLVFSCRERAITSLQNANDLAREAVSWNTVLGRAFVWFDGAYSLSRFSLLVERYLYGSF